MPGDSRCRMSRNGMSSDALAEKCFPNLTALLPERHLQREMDQVVKSCLWFQKQDPHVRVSQSCRWGDTTNERYALVFALLCWREK